MGFSLKDLLEEATAQVNFRDGGKTASSVRQARQKAAPAFTPPPGGLQPPRPQMAVDQSQPVRPPLRVDTAMKQPLPDMNFKGITESDPRNKTIFGMNAAGILPKANEKTYTVKADRDVSTNQDKYVAEFDQMNPEYQKLLVNQARELASKGDVAAQNTIKVLTESGRTKGDATDFIEGSNDRLYGGLNRGALRAADFVTPGKNTFGMERLADQQDPSNLGTRQFTQMGRQGEIAGTVQKGIVDAAALVLPSTGAQRGIEGAYKAKKTVEVMTKARALGLGAAETTALLNKATRVPKLVSIGANLAADIAVGNGFDALQQKGRGNEYDWKTGLAMSVGAGAGIPLATKGISMAAPKVVKIAENLGEGGYVNIPGGKRDPAPDLNPDQKAFINDYAEMLEGMAAEGKQGNLIDRIKKSGGISSSAYEDLPLAVRNKNGLSADRKAQELGFSSEDDLMEALNKKSYGKRSKAAWFDKARKVIEGGKAEFGASDDYKAIPTNKIADDGDAQIKKILETGQGSNRPDALRAIEQNQNNLTDAQRLSAAGGDTGQAGLTMPKTDRDAMLSKFQSKASALDPGEEFAQKYLDENPEQALKDYVARTKSEFGVSKPNIVSGDDAKFIIPGFAPEKSVPYHNPASQFAKNHYKNLLADTATKDQPVMIMAGGSGAGKTSSLSKLMSVENHPPLDDYAAVVDTNLANMKGADSRIGAALKSGRSVEINFVYRDPAEAFMLGVVPRAARTGRIITEEIHAETHAGSIATIKELAKKYKNDPNVQINVIDNSRGAGNSTLVPLDFLNDKSYSKDQVRSTVLASLDDAVKNNKLTQEQADGFKHKPNQSTTRPSNGSTLGVQPQQAQYPEVTNRPPLPSPATAEFEQTMRSAGVAPKMAKQARQEIPGSVDSPLPAKLENSIPSSKTSEVKLNTDRLDIDDAAKSRLTRETTEVINRLSNDELKDIAKKSGIDMKSYGVAGTKKKIAEQLNLRNEIITVEKQITDARAAGATTDEIAEMMKKSAELGRTGRSQGTDIARQLQARRIIADELATPQQKLYRLLDEAGVNPDVYTKRLANIDMNNGDEVVRAYRDMVPAKFEDWLDKYRYTNMLSSPLTHAVNIASNFTGLSGVAPVQKFAEGAIDAARHGLNGKPRTRYAGEAGAYVKGTVKSFPEAMKKFGDIVSGKSLMETPDADALKHGKLAYGGAKGMLDSVLTIIPKFLEASDQSSIALAKGGERASLSYRAAKGAKITGDIESLVDDAAKYRVFRQELGKEGQGAVLEAFDFIPKKLLEARNAKNPVVRNLSKYTLPFVTTPTNLFKQGIEYTPAGIVTLPGNSDKTGQLAKATMGTITMGMAAGAFAANDAITFSEPADPDQRNAYRAEGKQPYSVKIGNKWVSYSKSHPAIAFNFAVVAGIKDAQDKGDITDSQADQLMRAAAGTIGFFRDQSYMKAVGEFSSNLQLKDGADLSTAVASTASNYANQLAPFKSMVSWIGRQVDPTQRKTDYSASVPEQIYQNIVKDIPGLNSAVSPRTNPYTGGTIVNENERGRSKVPFLSNNALNPFKLSDDRGYGNTTGLSVKQRQVNTGLNPQEQENYRQGVLDTKGIKKEAKSEKSSFKPSDDPSKSQVRQLSSGKYYAKVGSEFKTFDVKSKADEAVNRYNQRIDVENFKESNNKTALIGDTYYYKTKDGDIKNKSKFDYESDKEDSTIKLSLDRSKASGDLAGWKRAAVRKYQLLEKKAQQYDPETESDQISRITLQAENLMDEMAKYKDYGGFRKPKTGRAKRKGSGRINYKISGYGVSSVTTGRSLRSLLASAKVGRSSRA